MSAGSRYGSAPRTPQSLSRSSEPPLNFTDGLGAQRGVSQLDPSGTNAPTDTVTGSAVVGAHDPARVLSIHHDESAATGRSSRVNVSPRTTPVAGLLCRSPLTSVPAHAAPGAIAQSSPPTVSARTARRKRIF